MGEDKQMRDVLLLFGMQGSGKGTQAERVMEKYDFAYISVGQLLREKADTDTRISEAQLKGVLVADDIIEATIEEKIGSLKGGQKILFDGFPRSESQLEMYKRVASRNNFHSLAIMIEIPEEEAVKRISTRYTCPKCGSIGVAPGKCTKCGAEMVQRADDTEEAVKQRIEIFKKDTAPLVKYFEENGEYVRVDGVGPFDVITERILSVIDARYAEAK